MPGLKFQGIRPGAEVSYMFPVLFPRKNFTASIERITEAMYAEVLSVDPIALDEMCHVHPLFTEPAGRATAMAYRSRGDASLPAYGLGTLPVAEKIAGELLILPVHPALSERDVDDIICATRKVATAYLR